MSKITIPEFRNDRTNMLKALAYTSYGLLCLFSKRVMRIKILFEKKLMRMMMNGIKMIMILSKMYFGNHYSQYFSPS